MIISSWFKIHSPPKLPHSFHRDFHVCNAQPLKELHSDVWPEIIRWDCEKLAQIGPCNISSHFIFNLDGTGFGASKSSRAESQKVIVPDVFLKTPIFKGKADLHFVIALCAISAAGEMLVPELITKLETEHPDSVQCGDIPNAPISATPKAFMTPRIVSDYLRIAIPPCVAKFRKLIRSNISTLIPFDGCSPHLSDPGNASAVQYQVILDKIPPQSSHLREPFDQSLFERLKIQYGLFARGKGISKISGMLESI
jgi:hypothetical protein